MEASKEQQGLLNQILPPRLEDAGLEDCALPPESIHEAFFKAAAAVKSRATSIFSASSEESGDCVPDPFPSGKDMSDKVVGLPPSTDVPDALVGVFPEKDAPGSCVAEKDIEEEGDKVVVVGGGSDVDKQEELGKGRGCVDGLQGLEAELKNGDKKVDDEEEERGSERPILTEGFV
ncbi:hypothetical protein HS088_TW12G00349 [Tripterygium wilfordii]|uniref:Uncharacterized protein n=1 Tax=Tripterygium wilfordii TaxID=458696 RepID=A0A7J7CYW6_TRIWF|nr:uncharacterized protein LOC120010789 [Tripterygium wilfordii]KAF5739149.1 hypothetical protein HS088_TW12G00349 [Tripterygium wilfordii]